MFPTRRTDEAFCRYGDLAVGYRSWVSVISVELSPGEARALLYAAGRAWTTPCEVNCYGVRLDNGISGRELPTFEDFCAARGSLKLALDIHEWEAGDG